MIKRNNDTTTGIQIDSGQSRRPNQTGAPDEQVAKPQQIIGDEGRTPGILLIRIARGDRIMGNFSPADIKVRLASEDLLVTDLYYDAEASDWLPLAKFLDSKPPAIAVKKTTQWPCYCGTGLPFQLCCGDSQDC